MLFIAWPDDLVHYNVIGNNVQHKIPFELGKFIKKIMHI